MSVSKMEYYKKRFNTINTIISNTGADNLTVFGFASSSIKKPQIFILSVGAKFITIANSNAIAKMDAEIIRREKLN